MAAFVPVDPAAPLGVESGPEEVLIVKEGTYTATASQPFGVAGPLHYIEVVIDFVKIGAAPSVTFSIEGFDVASGTWITLLTSAAIAANASVQLMVGPAVPAVANVSTNHLMRKRMRVTATHGNTDTCSYSITVVGSQ